MLSLGLIFIHGLAIVSLALITVPAWVKAAAILVCLAVGARLTTRYALLKTRGSIVKVTISDAMDLCQIEMRGGAVYHAQLKDADLQFGHVALLVFGVDNKTFKAVIAKDAVDSNQFYALRLYVRSFDGLKPLDKK